MSMTRVTNLYWAVTIDGETHLVHDNEVMRFAWNRKLFAPT